jgi:hypothetical protein
MINPKSLLLLLPAFLIMACSKSSNTDGSSNVPNESVNITFNITNSPYTALTTVGGVIYLTGGYRGIMVYRYNSNTIVSYDRACTYNISSAAAIVTGQNNQTAICTDCGSTYSLQNGSVNTGPSTIGLKAYTTTFNTSTNVVTIVN